MTAPFKFRVGSSKNFVKKREKMSVVNVVRWFGSFKSRCECVHLCMDGGFLPLYARFFPFLMHLLNIPGHKILNHAMLHHYFLYIISLCLNLFGSVCMSWRCFHKCANQICNVFNFFFFSHLHIHSHTTKLRSINFIWPVEWEFWFASP